MLFTVILLLALALTYADQLLLRGYRHTLIHIDELRRYASKLPAWEPPL